MVLLWRRRDSKKQNKNTRCVICISIFVKKSNLGRILFIFIHFLINSKSNELPQSLGRLCSNNIQGFPKSSFLYFISLSFSTIGLGKQIIQSKVVSFSLIHYFHTCCVILWLEYSICVLPRQRCACASMFSSHKILYFIARIAGTNSFLLFLWISRKITPLTAKNVLLRVSMYTYTYWLIGCRSCLKSGKIRMLVVKWLWKNETFEGKKRRGRPKVLNKAAKIVLKKPRYKIGDSTRKLSRN